MSKNAEFVSHKKSKQKVNGKPQLPEASMLREGEIAINFAENVETLSIKNESGTVVTFSSDNYYTEQKLGSGFTGENSGVTVTQALDDKQNTLSAGTGIEIVGDVISVTGGSSTVDQDFSNTASTNAISTKAVYSAVTDNELVWTNAFVALSSITSAHTADTSIHITSADRAKLDSITDTFGTMAYEDKTSYSSATEVNTALGGKSDTGHTHAIGDITNLQTALDGKSDTATTYTKSEVDARDLWVSGTGENAIVQKGGNNTASGDYSVAEGQETSAITETSHAEGYRTVASGGSSHAEGWGTLAANNESHAEGYDTEATGDASHSEGNGTIASGDSSHAEGYMTEANGDSSHAEGRYTYSNGDYSHAEGNSTSATSDSSHAEGSETLASGDSSHAEGGSTSATSYASHAEGSETLASGDYSHTEGYSTKANNQSEHASGQFNVSSSGSSAFGDSGNTLFSVGNGTANDARHNAFEIRQNGDIYITSGNSNIKLQDYIGSVETVTAITPSNSGSTAPIATKVVAENELTVSNALNNLRSTTYTKTEIDEMIGDIESILATI